MLINFLSVVSLFWAWVPSLSVQCFKGPPIPMILWPCSQVGLAMVFSLSLYCHWANFYIVQAKDVFNCIILFMWKQHTYMFFVVVVFCLFCFVFHSFSPSVCIMCVEEQFGRCHCLCTMIMYHWLINHNIIVNLCSNLDTKTSSVIYSAGLFHRFLQIRNRSWLQHCACVKVCRGVTLQLLAQRGYDCSVNSFRDFSVKWCVLQYMVASR